jgi:hypothetical protein
MVFVMRKVFINNEHTTTSCDEENTSYSIMDDVYKAPDTGTAWRPCISELLHIKVELAIIPNSTDETEYYILKSIERIPNDAILLFVGNKRIALTGWSFEDYETYYEKDWFSIKDAACFIYEGCCIYLLYADYVGLWNNGKYLENVK